MKKTLLMMVAVGATCVGATGVSAQQRNMADGTAFRVVQPGAGPLTIDIDPRVGFVRISEAEGTGQVLPLAVEEAVAVAAHLRNLEMYLIVLANTPTPNSLFHQVGDVSFEIRPSVNMEPFVRVARGNGATGAVSISRAAAAQMAEVLAQADDLIMERQRRYRFN